MAKITKLTGILSGSPALSRQAGESILNPAARCSRNYLKNSPLSGWGGTGGEVRLAVAIKDCMGRKFLFNK